MTIEYKKLIQEILGYGVRQNGRNGNQLIIPHYSFTLDLSNGKNRLLLLRKMWYRGIRGEFNTLISPIPLTNVKQFEANFCNYWKEWASEDGSLNLDYWNMLHPQLEDVIENIKCKPHSRRHVISLWNHENVENDMLSLACCWTGFTLSVIGDTLYMKWEQRSVDTMIGLPADIYLSYLFMQHIAIETELEMGVCMYSLSNVHIYAQHVANAKVLLTRTENDYDEPLYFELVK